MSEALLTAEELRALARARLSLRRPKGALPGGHRALRPGTSLEFADHRPYQEGDDFRLIDWAVYARHRRLVTKTFVREVEAPLYLLVDRSSSMGPGKKLRFAAKLAAALAFVAYRDQDRFAVHTFGESWDRGGEPRRGRPALVQAFSALSALQPQGTTDLNCSLVAWSERHPEPGLCVVISDFLAPSGYREGLAALRYGRHTVAVVQVLGEEDLDPPRLGEVRLLDVETRRGLSTVVGARAWQAYQEALRAWNAALATACRELGMAYFLFSASTAAVEAALTVVWGWGR